MLLQQRSKTVWYTPIKLKTLYGHPLSGDLPDNFNFDKRNKFVVTKYNYNIIAESHEQCSGKFNLPNCWC